MSFLDSNTSSSSSYFSLQEVETENMETVEDNLKNVDTQEPENVRDKKSSVIKALDTFLIAYDKKHEKVLNIYVQSKICIHKVMKLVNEYQQDQEVVERIFQLVFKFYEADNKEEEEEKENENEEKDNHEDENEEDKDEAEDENDDDNSSSDNWYKHISSEKKKEYVDILFDIILKYKENRNLVFYASDIMNELVDDTISYEKKIMEKMAPLIELYWKDENIMENLILIVGTTCENSDSTTFTKFQLFIKPLSELFHFYLQSPNKKKMWVLSDVFDLLPNLVHKCTFSELEYLEQFHLNEVMIDFFVTCIKEYKNPEKYLFSVIPLLNFYVLKSKNNRILVDIVRVPKNLQFLVELVSNDQFFTQNSYEVILLELCSLLKHLFTLYPDEPTLKNAVSMSTILNWLKLYEFNHQLMEELKGLIKAILTSEPKVVGPELVDTIFDLFL